jgi:hypothetical protein
MPCPETSRRLSDFGQLFVAQGIHRVGDGDPDRLPTDRQKGDEHGQPGHR